MDEARGEVLITARDMAAGEESVQASDQFVVRGKASVQRTHFADDLRANEQLYQEVENANDILTGLLGKMPIDLSIDWSLLSSQRPSVVQVTLEDNEASITSQEWFSEEQLKEKHVLNPRLSDFVGGYLQSRNHKLLQQIQAGSEE